MAKPALAVFSPLPPSRSGIADYCQEQLPWLARHWDVTAVIGDLAPAPVAVPAGVRVLRLAEWKRLAADEREALRLYHSGNNPHHDFVLREAREHPGVVVLHDFVLHHLVRTLTLGEGDFQAFARYLEDEYGAEGRRVVAQEFHGLYREQIAHDFPLNGALLSRSRGVIVHSTASLDRIRYRHPGLAAVRIPHHYSPAPTGVGDRSEARASLGVPLDRRIIAMLGFVTPPKQTELVFRALARLRAELSDLELWLVGDSNDEFALSSLAASHGVHDLTRYTGFVTTEDFYRHIAATDVVVSLRYPSAGETSGTLVRSLGMGACAIVFDFDSWADYPDDVVIKIPLDTERSEHLEAAIRRAILDPALRAGVGAAAARYVREVHSLARCAERYTEFLRSIAADGWEGRSAPHPRHNLDPDTPAVTRSEASATVERLIDLIDVEEFGVASVEYARTHARRWAETLAALPAPSPGMKALEIGSYQVVLPYLRQTLKFDYVAGTDHVPGRAPERIDRYLVGERGRERFDLFLFDAESDRFPFPDRTFDLVLACEVIEHLSRDPMFMVCEINRILKFGGVFVLSTPNIASARGLAAMLAGYGPYLYPNYNRNRSTDRHNIEYSPHVIAAILRAGGFGNGSLRTPDCWSERPAEVMTLLAERGSPTDLRGDVILAVTTKLSEIVDRYPPEVYGGGAPVRTLAAWGPGPT